MSDLFCIRENGIRPKSATSTLPGQQFQGPHNTLFSAYVEKTPAAFAPPDEIAGWVSSHTGLFNSSKRSGGMKTHGSEPCKTEHQRVILDDAI